jgi:hypothetical protein
MKELQSAMADCRLSTGKVNKVSNELVGKIKNLGDQTAKRMNAIDGYATLVEAISLLV